MRGNKANGASYLTTDKRFKSYAGFKMSDASSVLLPDHDYIVSGGYWNSSDEKLSSAASDYEEGIDTLRVYNKRIIARHLYNKLLRIMDQGLRWAGRLTLILREAILFWPSTAVRD